MAQVGNAAMRIQQTEMRAFSGPLPHPEDLEKYNQVLPGAADRIIRMAEQQLSHRQSLESKVVDANIKAQRVGTVLGFILALVAIGGGIFLVYVGKEATGIAAIITALAGLTGVFVLGKRKQQKELAEKSQSLTEAVARSR
jgi:uncharacterized membrane protein